MLSISNIVEVIDKTKVRFNEPMSKHTTIKIGGNADVLVLPEETSDIINVLKFAKENNIPVTVIGNGSKLLVRDKGIRGIVIKISSKFSGYEINGDTIVACAGMSMPRLSRIAMKEGLSGLEFACGIPGVLGGGILMNAGAYGGEISDVLVRTKYIDENLEVKTLEHSEHNFSYRYSYFKDHKSCIILSAEFKLTKKNEEEIKETMDKNSSSRKEKQPLEYPSAGSTFKRPEGFYVGTMIQELGLKGYEIGGAEISTKHAGFIVNKGGAKAEDVIALMNFVREKVFEKYGVKLENEIEIIGEE